MVTVIAGQANTVGVDIIDPQSTSGGGGVETKLEPARKGE
jgi:hypothetical protein